MISWCTQTGPNQASSVRSTSQQTQRSASSAPPFRGNPMKAQIIFYSAHGHIYTMAKAIEQGVRDVDGAEVSLYRVPELGPDDTGAAQAGCGHVPIAQPDRLADADAIFFGTPTRFGNMCPQMGSFLDAAASLWLSGALLGEGGSVFLVT